MQYPSAIVEEGCAIDGSAVIGSCVFVGRGAVIRARTRIQHGAFVARGSKIGEDVFIGPNAVLTDDRYPRAGKPYDANPPVLLDGCSIGAGAIILPGVTVGEGAMVGAGAVVVDDVLPHGIVTGVPGKQHLKNAYHT